MANEMAGKVAVVTGGARGIGKGIAEMFVAEGARVVIADIEEEAGRATAAALGEAARFIRTDIADRAAVQAMVDFAIGEFGGLHAQINNAGLSDLTYGPLLEADFAPFEAVVRTNLLGTMLCTQIAARHMAQAGGGSIVNISSTAGLRGGFALPIYRATKAGVQNFTQVAAIEFGVHDIRVNAICPANVPTAMGTFRDSAGADAEMQAAIAAAQREVRLEAQAIKREGRPEDIANAALYFASDRSTYVTGQILAVDAGSTIGDTRSMMAAMLEAKERIEAEYM